MISRSKEEFWKTVVDVGITVTAVYVFRVWNHVVRILQLDQVSAAIQPRWVDASNRLQLNVLRHVVIIVSS